MSPRCPDPAGHMKAPRRAAAPVPGHLRSLPAVTTGGRAGVPPRVQGTAQVAASTHPPRSACPLTVMLPLPAGLPFLRASGRVSLLLDTICRQGTVTQRAVSRPPGQFYTERCPQQLGYKFAPGYWTGRHGVPAVSCRRCDATATSAAHGHCSQGRAGCRCTHVAEPRAQTRDTRGSVSQRSPHFPEGLRPRSTENGASGWRWPSGPPRVTWGQIMQQICVLSIS